MPTVGDDVQAAAAPSVSSGAMMLRYRSGMARPGRAEYPEIG